MATDGVGGATVTRQAGGWVMPMEQPGSEMSIRVGSRRATPKVLNYIDRKLNFLIIFFNFKVGKIICLAKHSQNQLKYFCCII